MVTYNNKIIIRFAAKKDVEQILGIYAQYIDTPITFEYDLPGVQDFAHRIEQIGRKYPWLVAEAGGRIIGYAYAHEQAERAAYQWNAELSLYLKKEERGKGLGKKLYGALMDILVLQGIITAYARITIPNARSERLHANMGFRQICIQPRAGFKAGKWHDVAWLTRNIAPCAERPNGILPVNGLNKNRLTDIMRAY